MGDNYIINSARSTNSSPLLKGGSTVKQNLKYVFDHNFVKILVLVFLLICLVFNFDSVF